MPSTSSSAELRMNLILVTTRSVTISIHLLHKGNVYTQWNEQLECLSYTAGSLVQPAAHPALVAEPAFAAPLFGRLTGSGSFEQDMAVAITYLGEDIRRFEME